VSVRRPVTDAGFVLAFVAVVAGAVVQAATGIGLALVSAPALLIQLPAAEVVATVLGLNAALCALALVGDPGLARAMRARSLAGGALVGTPFGVLGLLLVDPGLAQIALGAALVVSGVLVATRQPRPLPREGLGALVAGFLSGLLNGGTGLSGPPVAVYLANQGWDARALRATLYVTFLASSVEGLAVLALAGRLGAGALVPIAMLLPAVALGMALAGLGRRAVARIPGALPWPGDGMLRRGLGVIVALGGLSGLVRGVLAVAR